MVLTYGVNFSKISRCLRSELIRLELTFRDLSPEIFEFSLKYVYLTMIEETFQIHALQITGGGDFV